MGRVCSTEEKKNADRILVGKPKGMRPLGRPRHRWEVKVKGKAIPVTGHGGP
jgi:hypothetical protein